MNKELNNVLTINGFIAVPQANKNAKTSMRAIATIVNNMNFYGFTPSKDALDALLELDESQINSYWENLKKSLESVTATDRNMGDFIVFKNFPQEVLNMSEAESFIKQIFIYWGVEYDHLREEEKERNELEQNVEYKVLALSNENTLQTIFNNLQNKNSAWNDVEKESALVLFKNSEIYVDISEASFKENGVFLAKTALETGMVIKATNATDVLRLAVKDGETLRGKTSFKKLKRSERRFFLSLLENTKNLEDDMAMKKTLWKKFFKLLHPSDYSFSRVLKAYDNLYNNRLKSFDSKFKTAMEKDHSVAMKLAKSRVGFFIRNFHYMYSVIGSEVLVQLSEVLGDATITQLVKLEKYITTVNTRKNFMVAPNGNWNKLQILDNKKSKISNEDIEFITNKISESINIKLNVLYPNGVILDEKTKDVKLPSNDLELDFYGRGTTFDIPKNIKTIRTASYWAIQSAGSVWFDNGFNFLGENFEAKGACYWNRQSFGSGAVFSGDPINIRDLKGRACQMLDLNIDDLIKDGVRYATWNVLSYNNLPFKDADDLVLTMQMCENPLEGKTYEPSLANMVFKVGGENKVKHIAYVDLVERKVVFLDLNINGNTQAASYNTESISTTLPMFIEHLNCSPSVYDIFKHSENRKECFPEVTEDSSIDELPVYIGYSDSNVNLPDGCKAFLAESVNDENSFEKIDLLSI